jgi:hypothetical protein
MKDKPSDKRKIHFSCVGSWWCYSLYIAFGATVYCLEIYKHGTQRFGHRLFPSSGKRARKIGPEIVCLSWIVFILPFHPRTEIVCLRNCTFIFAFLQTRWWTNWSLWPRGLRRGFAAARLLGLRFRIPPGEWVFVSCECCVLSCRGFCIGLMTRLEESYRVCCVFVWSWSPDTEQAIAR